MTTVYVTPAAMAEQGAALRALLDRLRHGLQRAIVAMTVTTARRPRVTPDHAEMARLRLVAHEVRALRDGAYAGLALGGPSPR